VVAEIFNKSGSRRKIGEQPFSVRRAQAGSGRARQQNAEHALQPADALGA
jgi:hypothetical protein